MNWKKLMGEVRRGGVNWKKGMGEARRGGHARTRVGCRWGAKSSAHFQEGPELQPSDLVLPLVSLSFSCLALLPGLRSYGKATGMAGEGRS